MLESRHPRPLPCFLRRIARSGRMASAQTVGEPSPFIVDVRIIAATNSNLEQLVQDGRFREDLFYRLNVIRLAIPPLRERRDEVPALVHHFVARAAAEFSKGRVRIAEETMEHLLLYPWPGNIRQLNNELRRMVALAEVGANHGRLEAAAKALGISRKGLYLKRQRLGL